MAGITIKSNAGAVVANIKLTLDQLKNPEYLIRPVCFGLIDLITKRIHIDGKASDGAAIGTYSTGYMKVRTGDFGNSVRFKRGAKKGQVKNAGVFTKRRVTAFTQEDDETVTSANKFVKTEFEKKARPNYNRTSDTKVIISLTRQLENDYTVIATEKGYGIGFKNSHNFQKSQWVQMTYNKRIFDLTKEEEQYAVDYINDLAGEAINNG